MPAFPRPQQQSLRGRVRADPLLSERRAAPGSAQGEPQGRAEEPGPAAPGRSGTARLIRAAPGRRLPLAAAQPAGKAGPSRGPLARPGLGRRRGRVRRGAERGGRARGPRAAPLPRRGRAAPRPGPPGPPLPAGLGSGASPQRRNPPQGRTKPPRKGQGARPAVGSGVWASPGGRFGGGAPGPGRGEGPERPRGRPRGVREAGPRCPVPPAGRGFPGPAPRGPLAPGGFVSGGFAPFLCEVLSARVSRGRISHLWVARGLVFPPNSRRLLSFVAP